MSDEIIYKICSKCNIEKCIDQFYLHYNKPRSTCKECEKKYRLENKQKYDEYYKNNDKIKQQRKEYRLLNKEKIKEADKEYRLKNKIHKKQKDSEYYQNNKVKLRPNAAKRMRKYRSKNRELCIKNKKEWASKNKDKVRNYYHVKYKNDPRFRLHSIISSTINQSLKENKLSKNRIPWEKLLGYTALELKEHLESLFTEDMSWDNHGTYWHIDHIIPQSWFIFDTLYCEEFKKCWSLANLQPLRAEENIQKSNKYSIVDGIKFTKEEYYNKYKYLIIHSERALKVLNG